MISWLSSSSLCLGFSHILLGISLISMASASFGFTNETDKQALLAIKDQIHEDPFEVLSSWNDSTHFCNWQGVTCSLTHQRVTVLNLASMNLVGSLSPHVGNLSFLRAIFLENNGFHGTIPQEVGRLFRLQNLSLGSNSFQGEFPVNLTRCLDIRVINISRNSLAGRIPAELGSVSSLLELDLIKNHFTGNIPSSLGNLSALQKLLLWSNSLEGSIPLELGQLSKLEYLQLASNNLSGVVPTQLYNISSIISFILTNNHLHGTFPSILGLTLPNLKIFLVAVNNFSGPIPSSLPNISGLLHFDITKNALTGLVPMNLGSLYQLQKLNIGGNRLGANKPNDLSFLDSLTNCTSLTLLNIHRNQFGGVLPNSFVNLSTNIISISIQGNYITGSIPEGIANFIKLEDIGLNENMLTGTIPESIGKLPNLEQLYIYANNISGNIPSSIGNLSRLSVLSVFDNMLEGHIPVSLGNCTNLQALDLHLNRLTGMIPEQVVGLSSLTQALLLNQNHLRGPLPVQVGKLINLGTFDVSENELSGVIPSTLGDCVVLRLLYMEHNFFQGTIPSTLEKLKGLQILDVSYNNLSGQIPRFLSEFSSIQILNLSYNMFQGEVPNEELFANTSVFSIVGNRKLCGEIKELQLPACPHKKRKHSKRTVVIVVSSVTFSIILLAACVSAIVYKSRKSKGGQPSSDTLLGNQYPILSYAELFHATNGFSSANFVGVGRYGSVYKGTINCVQQIVAVKVLNLQQRGADKSFLAECEALRNIRHRNLIKVITSCSSVDFKGNDFKALVFEFMPNGSLESWLYATFSDQQGAGTSEVASSKKLNLIQRLNIAIDVASALDYLHHQCETTIIHCDLKPSNVLLDNELCAHVGDFGMAKFLVANKADSEQNDASSSIGVRGTMGYVAPEYGMGAEVSIEGDLYSYGILLLEMFTGKSPTSSMFSDSFTLHNYVKRALPNKVLEIADPILTLEEEDQEDTSERTSQHYIGRIKESLASVFQVGVICSTELPRERMDMNEVVAELHRIRKVFLKKEGREQGKDKLSLPTVGPT